MICFIYIIYLYFIVTLYIYRVAIKEIDTFNFIKTVSVVDTQFA
jgi:hypothetical protein